MSLSKIILHSAEVLRPAITKVVPQEMLSKVKAKVIYRAGKNLENADIKPFDKNKYQEGINLIASIKSDTGLGQSARLKAETIEASSVPYSIYDFVIPPGGSCNDCSYEDQISNELPYNVNLIHVNASEMPVAYMNMGANVWDYRYNIGYWAWELEEFPEEWLPAFNLVDEVWTPSDFVTNTLKKYTDKPVVTIPHCISAPTDVSYGRSYFCLPENRFLFLVMFDSGSSMERKNPIAAIQAFHEAFGVDNPNVGLVIKINEPELSQKDVEIINRALSNSVKAGDERNKVKDGTDTLPGNVYVITGTYTKIEVNSLIKVVDVYVSLHRAEGFGLVLAEAMCVGTPVIATNWSANTEFMNHDVACMVEFQMIAIPEGVPPFPKGFQWADADVSDAAQYMRKLYEDHDYYQGIRNRAMEYIQDKLSVHTIAEQVKKRVSEIMNEESE